MKKIEFKNLIKEACREAFKEEFKDILLEMIRSSKPIINESKQNINESKQDPPKTQGEVKQAYMQLLDDMSKGKRSFNTNDIPGIGLNQIPKDTISEGSSLPEGEVDLNMIMNLTKNK